jgi:acyl-CoA thioester hydrolase
MSALLDRKFTTCGTFDPMPHEVDFTGFLSNTIACRWMETLRVRMVRAHMSGAGLDGNGNVSIIARTEIDYLAPIRFGDRVDGRIWLAGITPSRWQVEFEFFNMPLGRLSIAARQVGAFVDPVRGGPVRIPRSIINAVAAQQSGGDE